MAGIPNIDIDPPKYGPPNMAAQLFGMISSLPDAYQQGVKQKFERGQMARTEELQKPIVGPNGEPSTDYSTVLKEYLKRAGAEGAAGQLGTLWKQQFLEGEPQSGGSPYGPQNPRISPDAQTPGGLRGETGQPAQSAGPAGENPAHQNARQLAINAGIDPDSPELKQAFGKTIDRDFTSPEQAQAAAAKIKNLQLAGAFGPMENDTATPAAPPAQLTTAGLQASATGRPPVGGYMPGVQPPPTAPVQTAQAGQAVPSGAAGMVPPGADPRAYAQGLKQAAERERTAARREGIAGIPSKAREDKAAAYDKTADDILKEIGEAGRPTGPMKEVRDAPLQQAKGLDKARDQELARGDKLQNGIQGAAREFETALKPHLDAMRAVLGNPNFVSGSGVGFQEALNKIRSSPFFSSLPGYDPNAALPNEAIRKVLAANIQNQVTQLKAEGAEMGANSGRVFKQQIDLMEQASQRPENSAAALRFLTELQQRMGDHSRATAEMADRYEGKYGRGVLDNGFNRVLSDFNSSPKNQIFKPEEISDMRRFAPPPAPAFHTKEEATAWAHKNNIPAGDPIKLPSGKIIPAP